MKSLKSYRTPLRYITSKQKNHKNIDYSIKKNTLKLSLGLVKSFVIHSEAEKDIDTWP